MAHVSQELKKELAPAIKAVLKKYRVKGSIAVRHHSTLVVNLKEGLVSFGDDPHRQVNAYHLETNYEGEALAFLNELNDAMNVGNFDKSDSMTDYFHVGWYTDINIGQWNKPYHCTDKTTGAQYFGGMAIVEEITLRMPRPRVRMAA